MLVKIFRFRVLVALVVIILSAVCLKWLSMTENFMAPIDENQLNRSALFIQSKISLKNTSETMETRSKRVKSQHDSNQTKKTAVNVNFKNTPSMPKSNGYNSSFVSLNSVTLMKKMKDLFGARKTTPPHSEPTRPKVNSIRMEMDLNKLKIESVMYKPLESSFEATFDVTDSVDSTFLMDSRSNVHFVLVVPRALKRNKSEKVISQKDKRAAMIAAKMLNTLRDLDGLACLPQKYNLLNKNHDIKEEFKYSKEKLKGLFNKTWCNFKKRDWSIQIRNNGKMKAFQFKSKDGPSHDRLHNRPLSLIQMCNIVNEPFVMKKESFIKWRGLGHDFGRLSLLDFFVRTGGQLKIGKSADCFYSDDLFELDRGRLNDEGNFPEYSNFGDAHDVLRIIMEDRIEWTKCVATDKLCKEEPYRGPPTTLPGIAQPICCSVMLGQILKDAVAVFNKLGIQYRVVFGTLLGGERSGAIIPYTRDIDFTLEPKYGDNKYSYATLQKHFGNKYFISGHSFIDFPRLIPLMPVHLNITTAPFFKDEFDLEGDAFFSRTVNETVQEILPFSETEWNTRTYADFYRTSGQYYWNGSSTTVINGVKYDTLKAKNNELITYYGRGWRSPILKTFDSQSDEGQAEDLLLD